MDDYQYYLTMLKAYEVDVACLAETNTCWEHPHLRSDLRSVVNKHHRQSVISYGSPSQIIDPCNDSETYQAGGSVTIATGLLLSSVFGGEMTDPTGLGRWSGLTFRGTGNTYLSIITAYRTCDGHASTASLGSTYYREYVFFSRQARTQPTITAEHVP
jgi:hypothetical protein